MPIRASCEKTVVFSFGVTDMGQHREIDGGVIEALGRGGSANPVAVLPTGVLGDGALSPGRAPRISSPHLLRESLHVLAISSPRILRARKRPSRAGRRICDAGGLGAFEGLLLDQKALAFVATPGSAPFQYDGPKRGCLLGTPGERGISSREKLEVVEVGTGQAQGPFGLVEADPSGASQRRATLAAGTVPARNEDLDFQSTDHEVGIACEKLSRDPGCLAMNEERDRSSASSIILRQAERRRGSPQKNKPFHDQVAHPIGTIGGGRGRIPGRRGRGRR
jgi:hypothetical protein